MRTIAASILFLILSFGLQSCTNKEVEDVSFYHWKTNYEITDTEQEMLNKAKSKKLYLRFFDLVYNSERERVFPTATLQMDTEKKQANASSFKEVIPVIYITNEVFLKTSNRKEINNIASQTLRKIFRLKAEYFKEGIAMPEIQIDCDWTRATKGSYFYFLEALQSPKLWKNIGEPPVDFSATIRLHQVKFPDKTGVPPVNSGTIMFYNVGDLSLVEETNSILNLDKTTSYLSKLHEYPLAYNVALPIFGWGVLYRDDQLVGILSDVDEELLSQFKVSDKENWYEAKADTYINRTFVYKGDKLRVEDVSLSDFKELHKIVSKAAAKDYDVVLYHINSNTLKNTDIDAYLEILR